MADSRDPEDRIAEIKAAAKTFAEIAQTSQQLMSDFLQRQAGNVDIDVAEGHNFGKALMELSQRMMADPNKLLDAQLSFWRDTVQLWQQSASVFWGQQTGSVITPGSDDRRFRHEDWQQNYLFDFIKQSYLLIARWMQGNVGAIEGLDDKSRKKLDFYTRQFVDAMSPTNFPLTNPEVLRATLDSGGQNLIKGLRNLLADLERGKGKLSIRQTELDAFDLGKNVAVTPGKIIFQNDLMQLIQYAPSTTKVFKRPLLVLPPWINKYYILDLREDNSLIKWWVDQGFSVFVISWVNPDEQLADKDFADYMLEGPLAALDAIGQACAVSEVNAVGYCLGGTLLGATMAYMAAKRDTRIKSATYFATMLDFAQPGELEVFIDEEQIDALEKRMNQRGYLDGSEMATTFNMLRANDLIWSFFVSSYLLGKDPFPFDLLYWNSDSTRMPAQMHSFYLRTMYQNNLLKEPGGITLAGKSIDLHKVRTPVYMVATVDDHIAPWRSVYSGLRLFSGKKRFVLGGSGHIAGIVNPPAANKYAYWHNTQTELAADAQTWLEAATKENGSWWPDWFDWVKKYAGAKVAAREPGGGKLEAIEDAPGSYVKVRLGN